MSKIWRAQILHDILKTSKGTAAFLSDLDGRLVGLAGNEEEAKAVAAVIDNVWAVCDRQTSSDNANKESPLKSILVHNESGKIAALKINKFVLCIIGKSEDSMQDLKNQLLKLELLLKDQIP